MAALTKIILLGFFFSLTKSPYNLKIIFSSPNKESTEWDAHTSGLALTVPAPSSSATWGRLLLCGKREHFVHAQCPEQVLPWPKDADLSRHLSYSRLSLRSHWRQVTYCHSAWVCRDQKATELNKMWEWVPPSYTSVDILYGKELRFGLDFILPRTRCLQVRSSLDIPFHMWTVKEADDFPLCISGK